jgi:hypothetical protein
MLAMAHHIAYREMAPLRQAPQAKTYFLQHFDILLTIAVVIYRRHPELGPSRSNTGERDRLAFLSAALKTFPRVREWMRILQAEGGNELLDQCSEIAARILLGHESEFDGIEERNLTMDKSPAVKQFRDRVKLEFDL